MTDQDAGASSASPAANPPAATPYDLRIHFEGAFVFSITTKENSSASDAKITGVEVYVPICEHTSGASINGGPVYMLENYWHCIDPKYADGYKPASLTLGQLKTNIKTNTPWTPGNRPIGGKWSIAFKLPLPPEDWQCASLASATSAASGGCFSGTDADIIPEVVALQHILTYKQVTSAELHGACFAADFTPASPAAGTDLYIVSEVPYIPTKQHERRAADAMAALLGLDLVLEASIGTVTQAVGAFTPKDHVGNCLMGIVTSP